MKFKEATDNLLDFVNRPKEELVGSKGDERTMEDIAKLEINNAILWANRSHCFKYNEHICNFEYPGLEKFVKFTAFDQHHFMGLISVDAINDLENDIFGFPFLGVGYNPIPSPIRNT